MRRRPTLHGLCLTGTVLMTLVTKVVIAAEATEPLSLQSMGIFYVGGSQVESPYSDGRGAELPNSGWTTVAGQAKITFLIPEEITGANIVLIPGFGLSSSIYLMTPDGREGWAQFFARNGYPVYVMDLPGRGTATFQVDAINGCAASDDDYPCSPGGMLGKTSLEQPWSV